MEKNDSRITVTKPKALGLKYFLLRVISSALSIVIM